MQVVPPTADEDKTPTEPKIRTEELIFINDIPRSAEDSPTEPRLPISIVDFQTFVSGLRNMTVLAESCLVEYLPECESHDPELARRITEAHLALRSVNAYLSTRTEKDV